MSKTTNKFSPEVRERAVRLVFDNEGQHGSRWQAIVSIAAKIGCTPQTLNEWVKKAEVDSGKRAGIPTEMAEKMKALERENRELRQANEILRKASALFCDGGARPPVEVMVGFIDAHRDAHGVEPICRCCRSPRPPIMNIWPSGPIRRGCRIVRAGMRLCAPRSVASSKRTGGSTASARSGGSFAARASTLPDARWRG